MRIDGTRFASALRRVGRLGNSPTRKSAGGRCLARASSGSVNRVYFNPLFDPSVETGYLGYSLRGIAHRLPDRTFRASLEICDLRSGEGGLMREFLFAETFAEADAALERALGKGRQVIDDLVYMTDLDEAVET